MRRLTLAAALAALLLFSPFRPAKAVFEDTRFQGNYTTENLDAIIDAYELYDGWYWTTEAGVTQTFRGQPDHPGWTSTAIRVWDHKNYDSGWYGCRWDVETVKESNPEQGGYAECFGFAQFIGYLLSGERNPQGHWRFYYSVEAAGGLKVGDIVRSEYTHEESTWQHSAIVYSVRGEEITFLQVSGSGYNRISVGTGFSVGRYQNLTWLPDIDNLPWLRISRSPDNLN